jgi:glutathione S-transferase
MGHPVLWHFPVSHFNEKARWALDFKRVPHVRRVLVFSYLPRALWATGQGSLPILWIHGRAIADSTRIIEELERRHPDPPLYPADPALRRRALELEDFFDEQLGHALRTAILAPLFAHDPDGAVAALTTGMGEGARRGIRAVFPLFRALYKARHKINAATIEVAPTKVRSGLDRLAAEIQPSGYLAGDRFSVADLTAAALFSPLVQPPEFPYPPRAPMPRSLAEFRSAVADHPAFQWVLEMYRRHRGVSAETPASAAAA